MVKIIFTFFLVVVLVGCGGKRELTQQELAEVNALKTDLISISSDIDSAQDEYDKYSGGLIKSLISVRLETIKTTKALIEQRIKALEYGAPITISLTSMTPHPDKSAEVLEKIRLLEEEIGFAKKDADRYSGGLILAMKQSTIATQEQTLAMLKQKYLNYKYGISTHAEPEEIQDVSQSKIESKNEPAPETANAPVVIEKMPSAEGPFGLKKGLTKEEIELMTGVSLDPVASRKNIYISSTLPKPHRAFNNYVLTIGKTTGLCSVRAVGKDIVTSGYGIQIKTEFNSLESVLTEIYGIGKKTDQLLPDSIWKDADNWMMGMVKKDRYLFTQWEGKAKTQPLENQLKQIILAAQANNSSSGYLLLEYIFNNSEQCDNEEKLTDKDSL
ncbi:hypothetical protein [Paraglaciecola chathamensis]|uniref:hypothetical protein n=1 Tax=Paraglaciecola chathamensis TaxID=368405 RepID=UPI00270367C1|nr:hypothetical protein [Paraglaciecola chathamensis]MDO6560156.1 hypothetical protein [Paraglaciecola chathamensis]